MAKKFTQRTRVRHPEVIAGFCSRFRQAAARAGIPQSQLAKDLGDFRQETISRLARGVATSLPIDLMVNLVIWAEANGISARWLTIGLGPMLKDDIPRQTEMGSHINQIMAYSMLCLLAKRIGVDVEGILPGWMVSMDLPGGGVVSYPLGESVEKMEQQLNKKGE